MSDLKEPLKKAPWPPQPKNDKFFRYPKEYRVGKEKSENWTTIGKQQAVRPSDLVFYNFLTKNPREINWYLVNYVGCPAPKPPEKYYGFFGAARDELKKTGAAIYIPQYGESAADYLNRLGAKVVENYNQSKNKEPGGACFETCYARVKEAGRQVGTVLPPLDRTSVFGRLWGSYIDPKKTWLDLPEFYRGKGAAGAMAHAGLGQLVDSDGIWRGDLEPGAVIQTWRVAGDLERVRDGDLPTSYGHSFIFLNYVYSNSAISGIVIADQGYQNGDPLAKGDYGFWVGANLTKVEIQAQRRDPNVVRYGPNP